MNRRLALLAIALALPLVVRAQSNASTGAPPQLKPMRALVLYGSGKDALDVESWRRANGAVLERLAAGVTLAKGYPATFRSDALGLKPGRRMVIAGFCRPERTAKALALVKIHFREVYERNVNMPAARESCPVVRSLQAPPGEVGAAEQLVRALLAKEAAEKGGEVEVLGSQAGSFLTLGGKKPVLTEGVVVLGQRVLVDNDEKREERDAYASLYFVAKRGRKPFLVTSRRLPQYSARRFEDEHEAAYVQWGFALLPLSGQANALAVRMRTDGWIEASGRLNRSGNETTTLYVLSKGKFVKVLSVNSYEMQETIDWEGGNRRIRGHETEASLVVARGATQGLRDLEGAFVTKNFDGCLGTRDYGDVEPCREPPQPGNGDAEGQATEPAAADPGLPPEEKVSEELIQPEATRYCWNGISYEPSACVAE